MGNHSDILYFHCIRIINKKICYSLKYKLPLPAEMYIFMKNITLVKKKMSVKVWAFTLLISIASILKKLFQEENKGHGIFN